MPSKTLNYVVKVPSCDSASSSACRRFVIATGSRPAVLFIPGLSEAGYLTNLEVVSLNEQPRCLVMLGGGPVGIELAPRPSRVWEVE